MINGIEEIGKVGASDEIKQRKLGGKACAYYPEAVCTLPNLKFNICQQCPRAAGCGPKNEVKSVFDHVKAIAISFLNNMGFSISDSSNSSGPHMSK